MTNQLVGRPKVVATIFFIIGCFTGGLIFHFFLADSYYRAGYEKSITNLKLQFEKVLKENTMFYSEDLGVVFVPKGGDTFEVVIPDSSGQDTHLK